MAEFKDQVLDHDADGIREYDNAPPGWLMWMLYATIVFSVLYIGWYALSFGDDDYSTWWAQEQVADRAQVQDWFKDHPVVAPSADVLLAGAVDPAVLAAGGARFGKTCGPCHGEHAQGLIGPNLTDDRWLHGGKVTDVFGTIVKGVPAKGMPSWGRAFKPEELAALASYIRSLQGSAPANPKAPEGDPAVPEPLPGAM
jgi:cytochrome c oxidase cbb3-type subunit III